MDDSMHGVIDQCMFNMNASMTKCCSICRQLGVMPFRVFMQVHSWERLIVNQDTVFALLIRVEP